MNKTTLINTVPRFDLEDRISRFAAEVIERSKSNNRTMADEYLFKQLIRSSCSAALNYGEVQGTLSKRDYRFKASLVLKELKETRVALKILTFTSNDDNSKSSGTFPKSAKS